MTGAKPVGYFAWVKTLKGVPSPIKFLAEYERGLTSIVRKTHDEMIVPGSRQPLNDRYWGLSLDELASLFPL